MLRSKQSYSMYFKHLKLEKMLNRSSCLSYKWELYLISIVCETEFNLLGSLSLNVFFQGPTIH